MASITQRALNRATLARQLLLERVDRPAQEVIEHLLGLQAQAPNPPYFGLWSRLERFDPAELVGLIERREVVRIAAMRSTVHLMSARDALALRALVQPALERMLRSATFGKQLATIDVAELIEAGRDLVDASPRTGSQMSALLADRWPDLHPLTIQNAIRTHLALVQVPPRGLWGRSGQATLTTVESWLGRSIDDAPSIDEMIVRYLGAFGPASVADVQAWSGLTRLGEVIERLRPDLVSLQGPGGATLYDLPDAPRPGEDASSPVRLIAEFDNLTIAYADRTRILSDVDRLRAYTNNGIIPGMVLVDGMVHGVWKLRKGRANATLDIDLFRQIPAGERAAVAIEGHALLAFAAPTATHEVTVHQSA